MKKQFPTQSLVQLDKYHPRKEVGQSACTEWDRIVTPLQVEAWKKALVDYPDRELAEYVVCGIQLGFRIGFDYTQFRCKRVKGNMKSVLEHEEGERASGRKGDRSSLPPIGTGSSCESVWGYPQKGGGPVASNR